VEVVFSGPVESVAAMRKVCAQGPRGATVDRLDDVPDDGRLLVSDRFEVLQTV
jgi:hypothetical protein